MAAPVILAGAALIGAGLSAWMNWKGMKKGAEAQAAANRMNVELFREQQRTETKEKARDRRFMEAEQKRKFGQRNYETFLDRMTTMFNSKPKIVNNLVNLQKARGR